MKLNPPHGEPGHRCEIPVGAPLDSQPSTAVPTQQNQTPAQPANGGKGFLSSGTMPHSKDSHNRYHSNKRRKKQLLVFQENQILHTDNRVTVAIFR
ncbi:hypothetical protein [Paenimyroides ceti]|uniref:hypothetical protein n=1 Tax=Paenimyroides ceti TaxID=395087 RepID=UPI0037C67B19